MAVMNREVFIKIYSKVVKDQLSLHASSLAFLSIISIIPIFAIAYLVFSLAGGLEKIQGLIENYMFQNLVPSFADQIMGYFTTIKNNISEKTLGYFGFIGFLITSYGTFERMEHSFNSIWGIRRHRTFAKKIGVYCCLISLGPIFVGFSLFLGTKSLSLIEAPDSPLLYAFVAFLLTFFFFTCLFLFLPNQKVGKSSAMKAGFITAVLFEVAKQAYAIYINTSVIQSIYGALASVPLFLLWVYIVWFLILIGAELCFLLENHFYKSSFQETVGYDVDLLSDIIIFLFSVGKREELARSLTEISEALEVEVTCLLAHLDFLIEHSMLVEIRRGIFGQVFYIPTKSSKSVLLQDLLRKTQVLGYKARYLLPEDMKDSLEELEN